MRAMCRAEAALGEPLLQFIVMGALLFAGYRLIHPERPAKGEDQRIELTAADVRQLEMVWTARWHRAPTQEELQRLVESRIREEILYREALALGLERGDTIIKRRLAQKMAFLADDLSAVRTPSVEDLRAWYSRNSALFVDPGRRSFRHLYFSADRRGDRAPRDATRALVRLGGTPADTTRSRPSATRSCSRSTTPIGRRSRWRPSSVALSPGPCASCRSARGKGRSSRASVGIWCSSRPRRPVAFQPSTRSWPRSRRRGWRIKGRKSAASRLRRDEGALRGAVAAAVPRAQRDLRAGWTSATISSKAGTRPGVADVTSTRFHRGPTRSALATCRPATPHRPRRSDCEDGCHLLRPAIGVVVLEHERVADSRERGCIGGRTAEPDKRTRWRPAAHDRHGGLGKSTGVGRNGDQGPRTAWNCANTRRGAPRPEGLRTAERSSARNAIFCANLRLMIVSPRSRPSASASR